MTNTNNFFSFLLFFKFALFVHWVTRSFTVGKERSLIYKVPLQILSFIVHTTRRNSAKVNDRRLVVFRIDTSITVSSSRILPTFRFEKVAANFDVSIRAPGCRSLPTIFSPAGTPLDLSTFPPVFSLVVSSRQKRTNDTVRELSFVFYRLRANSNEG